MQRNISLLCGPLAALILFCGIVGLGFLVPGYNPVRQTVSEIGEIGSPARIPFAIVLLCVAACLLVFAVGVRDASIKAGNGRWGAYLIGFMALPAAGIGIFAFPHPLHNVFGESELIGYQAPLALALAWRGDAKARSLVTFSWILFAVIWISMALNLSSIDRHGSLWAAVGPYYGLVQRSLFAAWFAWCAVIGVMLWRRAKP